MDRISRLSCGEEAIFENLRVGIIKPRPSACEATRMKASLSKSEATVLNWKKMECSLRVKDECLPQAEEFKYVDILFISDGRLE